MKEVCNHFSAVLTVPIVYTRCVPIFNLLEVFSYLMFNYIVSCMTTIIITSVVLFLYAVLELRLSGCEPQGCSIYLSLCCHRGVTTYFVHNRYRRPSEEFVSFGYFALLIYLDIFSPFSPSFFLWL